MSLCFFWRRVHFKGVVKFSKILKRVAHKGGGEGGGEGSDRFRIFRGGEEGGYLKRGEINISGWG